MTNAFNCWWFRFFTVSVETTVERVLFLFFYHIVFIMFVWSYWQTVFTSIGKVPTKVIFTKYLLDSNQSLNSLTIRFDLKMNGWLKSNFRMENSENLIIFSSFSSFQQFRIPSSEMDRLLQAENPNTQKRILEVFAKDLPISNRYVLSVILGISVILKISVIPKIAVILCDQMSKRW